MKLTHGSKTSKYQMQPNEIGNLSSLIINNEIEFRIKNSLKTLVLGSFTAEYK